jgi:thiol:disulfide interchange protein DsbD
MIQKKQSYRFIQVLITILLLTGGVSKVWGQLKLSQPADMKVNWQTNFKKVDKQITLEMKGSIPHGLHVFSVKPPDEPANIPTSLELAPGTKGVRLEGKLEESGKLVTEFDPVFNTNVRYFKNEVTFTQKFVLSGKTTKFAALLKYQVCDESGKCVMQTEEVNWSE